MSQKQNLILIGGGGHCKSVIDVIRSAGIFEIRGILDAAEKKGTTVSGCEIIGTDGNIESLHREGYSFHITIGQIRNATVRRRIFDSLVQIGASLPAIVSDKAYVSAEAQIGAGTIIMHQALVNAGASVGSNSIINNKALVEHDAVVGNHCHISTAAIMNGDCRVGDECFLGSNAVLLHGVCLGSKSVVGAGSVVTGSAEGGHVWVGNPAKQLMK